MNMSKGRRNLFLFPGFLGKEKEILFYLVDRGMLIPNQEER